MTLRRVIRTTHGLLALVAVIALYAALIATCVVAIYAGLDHVINDGRGLRSPPATERTR